MQNVGGLSDEELLSGVQASLGEERRWVARVVSYLAEIDKRRLYAESACSSLFDFCQRRLGMSEGEAFRRMTAARIARRFPLIIALLDRGDVHLSGLVLLRDHLTDENHEELLREASGKSKLEIAEMIATRSPKPDVPSRIVELPSQPAPQPALDLGARAPTRTVSMPLDPPTRVEPLAFARYRVELTASKELRDKLQHAQDLMRHRNPSGDLGTILEKSLDLLIAKLEKERLGKRTQQPTKSNETGLPKAENEGTSAKTETETETTSADTNTCSNAPKRASRPAIPRSVRRAVYERDGQQCSFVDDAGRRCRSRAFLELDHVVSKALGGSDDVENLRVRCRLHNRLHAERVFGRAHVERQIRLRQRKCKPTDGDRFEAAPRGNMRDRFEAAPHGNMDDRFETAPRGDMGDRFETAARGLRNLGFRDAEVQRALAKVRAKLGSSAASIETILREALAVAT